VTSNLQEGSVAVQWSRFNLMFESKNNGWLLYNSASNSFVQMDDSTAEFVKQVKETPNMDFLNNQNLYFNLINGGFLVDDGKDEDFMRTLKMKRTAKRYDNCKLKLTIAPTRECNFDCPYCFEDERLKIKMTDETEENLVHFIEKHKKVNDVTVTWYGGEPLLEFERMKSLSKKIDALGKKYRACIISNGYCMNKEVIAAINELKIQWVQITIDGLYENHDKRRYLIEGGSTFDVILENIGNLLQSDWMGQIYVRVNIDSTNCNEFADIYNFFKNKYSNEFLKHIFVYPGFVCAYHKQDSNCYFNSHDQGRFLAELARDYGIVALPIFPRIEIDGCDMAKMNAYVVGPEGEVYKCWEDMGRANKVIGNINSMDNWNTSLVAEGMIGASYLEDKVCEKCYLFPICDGGCSNIRMLNNHDNGKRDYCTYFKSHAQELLEIHYEQKLMSHSQ